MKKSSLAVLLCAALCAGVFAQQPAPQSQKPQSQTPEQQKPESPKADAANQSKAPTTQRRDSDAYFVTPTEVNVRIEADSRTFVVMAALNIAGFDYEPDGQPLSPARVELRKDLAKVDPEIKGKLAAFYKSHRRPGIDEATDAERYAALSLMMTAPPGFTVYQAPDRALPDDLKPLLDFAPLVREFYLASGVRELIPKYTRIQDVYVAAYRRPIGQLIYQVLEYFHTRPETVVSMKPLLVTSETESKKKVQRATVVARNRSRQMYIIPDPLSAMNAAIVRGDILNQKEDLLLRRVGDDYIVVVGPSRMLTLDPVREALIRFVLDPVIERKLKFALQYKNDLVKLEAAVPTASKEYSASVYLMIRESLAQAAEARFRRIRAGAGGSYSEDDATFDLAQAYLRGACLSFHFYESLVGFEKVGIGLEDSFEQMLETVKWDREALRARETEAVVARVAEKRAKAAKTPAPTDASLAPIVRKILLSDDLIRRRQFFEAKPILEEVLAAEPNNARALYGMAQVMTNTPSTVEQDPKGDENDKIQAQHDRLETAIKLYRKAIANASRDGESWLIQWSHVYLGRIFDFEEFRADALAEYEKAIALGRIDNGAYNEALEGKERPFGQKQ